MPDIAVVDFFASYAYQPLLVYSFIILFMTASSFGLPIPEEMTLVSAGLVAYMARHPLDFPPPTPDAQGVNLTFLAILCFFTVLGSDLLVYFIGKFFGKKLMKTKFFNSKTGQKNFAKIDKAYKKYGYFAPGLFRFTPGVRFPGHMSCGLMGMPLRQFILVDGLAALVSVPTQVILVAFYGEIILSKFKEFKIIIFGIIASLVILWVLHRLYKYLIDRRVN